MDKKLNTDKLETLRQGVERGIIDLASVEVFLEEMNRQEILAKHEHKIWQNKKGKWNTYIPCEGFSKGLKLVCKKERKDLEDAIIAYYKAQEEAKEVFTFNRAFDEWSTKQLETNNWCESSYRTYTDIYHQKFKDPEVRELDLSKSTVEFWQDFLEDVAPTCTTDTFDKVKTIVRGTLAKAKKDKHLNHSIDDIFETLEVSPRQLKQTEYHENMETYSQNEFEKLEKYFTENPNTVTLGILLLFVTGMRIGELRALYREDFGNNYTITVSKTVSVIIKDGKHVEIIKNKPKTKSGYRTIPVPKEYYWLVDKMRSTFEEDTVYAFKSEKNDWIMSGRTFDRWLDKACNACSVPYKSLHKIRKTYCTTLLDRNVSPRTVATLAGHSSPTMTLSTYYKDRTTDADKRAFVDGAFAKA